MVFVGLSISHLPGQIMQNQENTGQCGILPDSWQPWCKYVGRKSAILISKMQVVILTIFKGENKELKSLKIKAQLCRYLTIGGG